MKDSYFSSETRARRYEEMKRTGDLAGLRRLEFGRTLYNLRQMISADFSQGRAAERAGMTRPQWNRIENGKVRPLPSTIPRMAEALDINPDLLFKIAGYEVPEEFALHDKKYGHQRLDDALKECISKARFFLYLEVLWEEYQAQQMETLPEKIAATPAYAELLAKLLEHLSFGRDYSWQWSWSRLHRIRHFRLQALITQGFTK